MTPKISVIIIVYNTEKYLPECIESVTNQTLKDIEIIVVNDQSPGNCIEIVEAYQKIDERIKLVNLEKNSGSFMARQTGILAATGEYIQHLDSDDWLELNACETVYSALIDSGADACLSGYQRVRENKIEVKIHFSDKLYTKDDFIRAYLNYRPEREQIGCNYSMWCYVIKKEIVHKTSFLFDQFREHIVVMDDFLHMSSYVPYVSSLIVIPYIGYNYRDTIGVCSTMDSKNKGTHTKFLLDALIALKFSFDVWKKTGIYSQYEELCNARLSMHWNNWYTGMELWAMDDYNSFFITLDKKDKLVNWQEFLSKLNYKESKKYPDLLKAYGIKYSIKKIVKFSISLILSIFNKILSIIGVGKKFQ